MTLNLRVASELAGEQIRSVLDFWVNSPESYEALEKAIEETDNLYLEAWR